MTGITVRFGAATALNCVDFEIVPGEIHAILGENGAGKSTLMNVLSGSLKADRGEIRFDGKAARIETPRAARRLGIAMVHQHFTLAPAFTVAENLALDARGAKSGGVSRWRGLGWSALDDAAHALELARSLSWPLPPDTRVSDLAVGTQQRVEIVKALATGAQILIFDEPTAVLAGSEVQELSTVLRRLREEGRAIVLIAHKLAEILDLADRVTVLRLGNKVVTASRSEIDAPKLAGWMMGVPVAGSINDPAHPEGTRPSAERPADVNAKADAALLRAAIRGSSGPETPYLDDPETPAAFNATDCVVLGDRGEQSIRGVSFAVRPGEIFGIGGVDGNGQAEIAEALVGLRPLHSGALKWRGEAFRPGALPSAGYIPQDRRRSGLAVTMTVEENLLLDAVSEPEFRSGPFLRSRALKAMASDLMERFDIRASSGQAPVSSLSGGNQQKIVVARALRSKPEWIVAVNPTRGLDIGATRFVWEQLRGARRRGAAIVLISTDLDELAALSDRAAILSAGSLTPALLDRSRAEEMGLLLGGLGASAIAPSTTSSSRLVSGGFS